MRMCCVCYLCMTGLLWSRTAFTHVTAYIYYSIIIVSNWLCKYVSPKSSINHLVVCACVCVSVQRCAQSTASAIWENNTKIECSCRDEPNEVAIAMRERIAHICRAPWRPVANTHCICAVGGCYLSLFEIHKFPLAKRKRNESSSHGRNIPANSSQTIYRNAEFATRPINTFYK